MMFTLPPAESCIIKSIFQEKEEKLEVSAYKFKAKCIEFLQLESNWTCPQTGKRWVPRWKPVLQLVQKLRKELHTININETASKVLDKKTERREMKLKVLIVFVT
ncbi:hypothetical protein C5167_002965 [Papaver somniferum]|uniref:Uncharacterized protein n=1 Tax=Papaver somniferum TaxID=3469 RepID=A0A4Y7L299_PAPSO|nr:hypothetical protein C5167_002965 [Papaver somniferum]